MQTLDLLRIDLAKRVKNGLPFILAAILIWLAITYVWTLDQSPSGKSILTFIVGAPMLPLAFALTKLLKADWTIPDNPLQPLGLWLNFAQLFYFPILFFTLSRHPEDFVMVYAIITGAHFFPYGWFYKTNAYPIVAGVVAVGAMFLRLAPAQAYLIPLFVSVCLMVLAVLLYADYRKKLRGQPAETALLTT